MEKNRIFRLNNIEVLPGQRWSGYLELDGGKTQLPASVLHGEKPGKTMQITAGVHSGEYVGIQAANRVPELRQRIVGDKIVEFDFCNAAHTVALADETFGNCLTDGQLSFEEFLEDAKARQEETKHHHGFVGTQEDETPLLFFSCVPWVAFTQVIQPAPIPADCNPRIVYGKFIKEGDRILMPVGIQANHALVDGRHIGKFYQAFEEISREVCSAESLQP